MLLDHSLHNYFAPDGLNIVSILFNLETDNKVNNWPVCVLLALSGLCSTYNHVILLITDHTNQDTGDLFLGKNEGDKDIVAAIDKVGLCVWGECY